MDTLISQELVTAVKRFKTDFKQLDTFLLKMRCLKYTGHFIFIYGRAVLLITRDHRLLSDSHCMDFPYCVEELSDDTLGIGYRHGLELFHVSTQSI